MRRLAWMFLPLLILGCNQPIAEEELTPTEAGVVELTVEPTIPLETTSPASPLTPDLSATPLVWFGPLPPMTVHEGRPYIGSEDFMELFRPEADWEAAAGAVHVFKLYGEWVAYNATEAELRQVVQDIRRRGMALAVEAGPLDAPESCGQDIEGFAGTEEGRLIARRIKEAGGEIDLLALDEPYYFAHVYDGPNACRWSAEKIALEVAEYIDLMKEEFPEVRVGDTEPFPPPTSPEEYRDWLLTFREVAGYDLAFFHMDLDWARHEWPQQALQMEAYGRELGVPIGIIYIGNAADLDDESWIGVTGERIKQHEMVDGANPDHVLFQSWVDHPDFVLPESNRNTFTGLIRTYSRQPEALGFLTEGAGANLALGKAVRVSSIEAGHPGEDAVDGDTGTHWSAGAGPVQWIEIDLGSEYAISSVELTTSQHPPGGTVHRVLVRGEDTGAEWNLLHTFESETTDGDRLIHTLDEPRDGIRYVRVVTDATPSWVAWREIQVIAAD